MKIKPLPIITILGLAIILSACAEIQFVAHTAKRINNHFREPQETVAIVEKSGVTSSMAREDVKELQSLLTERGFDTEEIDGIVGPLTRKAVLKYQVAADIPLNGTPSMELLAELRNNNEI